MDFGKDIVGIIANFVVNSDDFKNFRLVCRLWHRVSKKYPLIKRVYVNHTSKEKIVWFECRLCNKHHGPYTIYHSFEGKPYIYMYQELKHGNRIGQLYFWNTRGDLIEMKSFDDKNDLVQSVHWDLNKMISHIYRDELSIIWCDTILVGGKRILRDVHDTKRNFYHGWAVDGTKIY